MTSTDKAPERIWAWNDETPTEKDKSWSACDAGTGSTEYIRADLNEAAQAKVAELRGLLQAQALFADAVADAADINMDESYLEVSVMPDGKLAGKKSWGDIQRQTRAALAKGGE